MVEWKAIENNELNQIAEIVAKLEDMHKRIWKANPVQITERYRFHAQTRIRTPQV